MLKQKPVTPEETYFESKMTAEPAKVFEDRRCPGDWRVEGVDDDSAVEVAIFSGPNARERALRCADRQYGRFNEISLERYP